MALLSLTPLAAAAFTSPLSQQIAGANARCDVRMQAVASWYDAGVRLAAPAQVASAPAELYPADDDGYPTAALLAMDGLSNEVGDNVFDPWKLASPRFTGDATPSKIYWYRAAELKHGRIAMAACVGWLVGLAGINFGGFIQPGVHFSEFQGANPLETWANIPVEGKMQMLVTVGLIEITHETENMRGGKHYLQQMRDGERMGRVPVPFGWDPLRLLKRAKRNEEEIAKARTSELKNGRLAMIGIASFYAAQTVPGSVPFFN